MTNIDEESLKVLVKFFEILAEIDRKNPEAGNDR